MSATRSRSSRAPSLLRAPRVLWLAAPWLTWAGSLQAQGAFHGGNIVIAPTGIPGPFKRLVSGDVSGDRSPEVAAIKGSTLIVYHDPDVCAAVVQAGVDATDLCFADNWDGTGEPAFLYTTSTGLARVTYDSVQKYHSDAVSSSSLWVNAPILRPSSDASGSVNELFGVASGARTVFRSALQAGGFSAPAPLFNVGYDVVDIAPLEWDGDSQTEIVVLHSNGVQVREQDGTIRMSRASTSPGCAIAVVERSTYTDSLAWHVYLGGPKLLLFNKNFPTQTVAMGAQYDSMVTADLEADRKDDLVLATSSSSRLHILRCGSSTPWFQETPPDQDVDMSLDGNPHPSSGKVLCANLFNDWNAYELPIPAFALATVIPDGVRLLPQAGERAKLSIGGDFRMWGEYWSACTQAPQINSSWKLKLGNGWGSTSATHVEMVVRKCPSGSPTPDPDVFRYWVFSLADNVETPGAINGMELSFRGAETIIDDVYSDVRYFVEVRPIRKVGNHVIRTWRWSVLGMGASCNGVSWMMTLPPGAQVPFGVQGSCCLGEGEFPVECDVEDDQDQIPGVIYVPSAVPQSRIPGGPWDLPNDP